MITHSAKECIALLLLIDKEEVLTGPLASAQQKLASEYKRLTGEEPLLAAMRQQPDDYRWAIVNPHQQELVDQYFRVDPNTRLLGFHKGRPILHAHVTPMRLRSTSAQRNVVGIGVNGMPFEMPKNSWAEDFVPAEGVTFAEAATIIEAWVARKIPVHD